ncbi:MAG TPA: hypothetical protein VK489_16260 [Ferruginibacter sp.]|nr:hypothetical protein [Ferruginibacter sp.]
MKKIFTLLVLSSVMLTSAFAQYGKDERGWNDDAKNGANQRFDKDDKFNGGKYHFTPRERDMAIEQIKREYNFKIQALKNKYFMSSFQKKRQIEFLKDQREKEIARVIFKFNDRKNLYGDRDRDYGKRKNW